MQVRDYSLYRHTFPNGKMYIGITKKTPICRRWQNGKGYCQQPKMAHAIAKYGWVNVRHDILLIDLTEQEAKFWEQFYIRQFNTVENGYNITFGGDGLTGVKRSEATKRKIGEANRQKNYSGNPEVLRAYVSQHGAWNKGKPLQGEHLRKIAEERQRRCNKSISACDPHTHEVVLTFVSCTAAAKFFGVSKEVISRCAHSGRKTAAGYEWRYANASV